MRSNPVATGSAMLIVMMILVAALAPYLAPYSYDAQDNQHLLQAPSREHPMGTDGLGRDLLSRLIYGARLSLTIGIFTAFSAMVIGTLYGAVSGYAGGWLDNGLMRGVDVV
jgi:ABC-type dipeptide/oligopeptide/nickel transport system permease subunit